MAHNHSTDYLIIGNSAAGVSAAEHIRAHDAKGSILIISREPYRMYGRPLISYLVEGKVEEDRLWFKGEGFYRDRSIDVLLGESYEAVSLDAQGHRVTLRDGSSVSYGKCLVATGSIPVIPPIEGIEGKGNVFPFLTLDQARAAWECAAKATEAAHAQGRSSRALIIGSGLIGLKAAEALSCHVDEVVLLSRRNRVLPAVLDESGSRMIEAAFAAHSVVCLTGVSADKLMGDAGTVSSARLTDGSVLECDLVIAASGVRPNMQLAVDAGAEADRGLVCGPDMQTSLPDVYAAGDVTQVTDTLSGQQRPLALWQNAVRQGKVAGLAMAQATEAQPFEGNFAVNSTHIFENLLLTSGITNPSDEEGFDERVYQEGSSYAKFIVDGDQLIGYVLINRPEGAGIYTFIIEQRIPLSSLGGGLFELAPTNLHFPEAARWERMHESYPAIRDERGWKESA